MAEQTIEPIIINPPSAEQSEEAQQATSLVVANAKALKIKTRDDLTGVAASALSQIKQQSKRFETQRVEMKAPSLEAGRRVDSFFKPYLTELAEAKKIIKNSMIDAKRKFDKEDAEKAARIEARAEKEGRGRITEETAIRQISEIPTVGQTVKTAGGGASTFRKVKKLVVTDLAAIPREYLIPKTVEEFEAYRPYSAIRDAAFKIYDLQKAGHNIEQIAGVTVIEEDSISAR